MQILRNNAEARLTDTLKSIRVNGASWRAIHYRLSALGDDETATGYCDILLGYIIEQLSDREGYTFVSYNKDVFLLSRANFRKNFETIQSEFMSHINQGMAQNLTEPLIKNYDLALQWQQVFDINEQNGRDAMVRRMSDKNSAADTSAVKENYQKLFAKGLQERKNRTKPCILLVEDDPLSLHLAKRALEKHFVIETASNASEARISYLSTAPDVVFLDIGLPDTSGHNLLGEFMTIDRNAYVVMLSGNSFQKDIMQAMRMGARGFVGKPFSRAKLLQYVVQSPHCAENVSLADLH